LVQALHHRLREDRMAVLHQLVAQQPSVSLVAVVVQRLAGEILLTTTEETVDRVVALDLAEL
jgi:hypothetical protein